MTTITNLAPSLGRGAKTPEFAGLSRTPVSRLYDFAFDSSYPDNGESLSTIFDEFSEVIGVKTSPLGSYYTEIDQANKKIIVYSAFPGTNEIQTVALTDGPTGGTFTLTYAGQTTTALARNASAATVAAALEALSTITGTNEVQTVVLTGFGGTDSFKLTQNTIETISFVRGTNATAAAIQAEIRSVWGDPAATVSGITDSSTFVITFTTGKDEGAITVTSPSGCTGVVTETTPGVPSAAVVRSGSGTQADPYVHTITFQNEFAGENIAPLTATGTSLTDSTLTIGTTTAGTGVKERQTLTLSAGIADETFKLTFNSHESAAITIPPGGYVNVTKAQVAAALLTISDWTAKDIISAADGTTYDILVGGTPGTGVFTLDFSKSLTGDIGAITVTSKVGAANGSVAETTKGVTGVSEVQTIELTDGPTAGTFTITFSGQTTSALAYNASGAAVTTALEALSNVVDGEVADVRTGAGTQASPYVHTLTWRADSGNVAEPTATGAALLGSTVTIGTTTQGSEVTDASSLAGVSVKLLVTGYAA